MAGPASATDDEYATLGLAVNSTEDLSALTPAQIRRAYRAAALVHHPDKPTGNTQQFSRVFLAYESLQDAAKRRLIDSARDARRLRLAQRRHMDASRRVLRDKLERAETAGNINSNINSYSMDDDAVARMQAEIEALRKEATNTANNNNDNINININNDINMGAQWKGNPWASVAGFADLMGAKIPFDEFESDVLAKYIHIPDEK